MMKFARNIFVYMTTRSYSNLSRLFMRLFVGVMVMQIGMNQMAHYEEFSAYYSAMGYDGNTIVCAIIVAEVLCSLCLMLGLLTRVAIVPLFVIMCYATKMLMAGEVAGANAFLGMSPEMLPIMFVGAMVYFGISGPGKISLDYILARYIVSYDAAAIEDERTLDEA